jgi:predicted transposase YdaD
LQLQGQILHLEYQTKLESNPPLPLRMLDYWVRLHRLYRLPITQVVVLLLPPSKNTVIETAFVAATTRHEYRVIRLWEEDPAIFLSDPALLPFAPLASATSPEQLLREVAGQVNLLEGNQLQEVSTYTQILAGLKFKKDLIRRIFREGMMRESVIYQEILEEGRQEGERSLVLLLLEQRVGQLSQIERSRISTLSLERLEALALALLDFSSMADLTAWLEQAS